MGQSEELSEQEEEEEEEEEEALEGEEGQENVVGEEESGRGGGAEWEGLRWRGGRDGDMETSVSAIVGGRPLKTKKVNYLKELFPFDVCTKIHKERTKNNH